MKVMADNIERVQENLLNWWQHGPQDKPLLVISCLKENPEPIPDTDDLEKYWTDVDFLIERSISLIDNTNYYGVAVPWHYVDFSATAMACVLGGRIEYVNKETIWSHPVYDNLEDLLKVQTSEENIAYHAQMEATRRSAGLAKGHHYISTWNFGGVLDAISGLYDSSQLLIDLLMDKDKVQAVMDHITDIWIAEYKKHVAMVEQAGNDGHVCGWTGIWAPGGSYPIQEDVSYMLSPDMFRELCMPRLRRMIDAVEYPLYHLDGDGAICHLDALLEIENLPVIQWQPGAGKEPLDQWYPLIRKILESGKSCQVFAEPHEIDDLVKNVGTRGLLALVKNATNADAEELVRRYGLE